MGGKRHGGKRPGGKRPGGKRHGGQKVGGQKVGGQKVGGQKTGGQKTGGQKTGGQKTGGQKTGGQKTGGKRPRTGMTPPPSFTMQIPLPLRDRSLITGRGAIKWENRESKTFCTPPSRQGNTFHAPPPF